jgi:[ribosomal protein S18]-alanine N-acetyltransferase
VASLSIERMRASDLPDVLVIERASFSMPWSRGAFLYEIEQNQVARCWVGRDGGRIVGYICLWEVADELHVTNVAVHPDDRRRGIARALLESVFARARAASSRMVLLEVRPSNTEALALYESFGFRVVGRRRGYYYDTGEDALVMEASVTSVTGAEPPGPAAREEPRSKGKWR